MTPAYYYPTLLRRLDRIERTIIANRPGPRVVYFWDSGEDIELFGPGMPGKTLSYEEAAALEYAAS